MCPNKRREPDSRISCIYKRSRTSPYALHRGALRGIKTDPATRTPLFGANDCHCNFSSFSMCAQSCRHRVRCEERPPGIAGLRGLLQMTELIPTAVCCVVSTSFIQRMEGDNGKNGPMIVEDNNQGHSLLVLITHPAPGLMLGSCVLLGCCLSSFAHRRQDEDRYQAAILIWLAIWGAALGKAIGASANMITLAFIPWALCAAMPLSLLGHAVLRRVGGRKKTGATSVAYASHVSSDEKFLSSG